ncbi:MAG: hypothetical protein FJW20_01125 [Acidimicrobiia bacterium]|nr:hypothetical protein [Acidimicrobiia bacterium]
MSVTAWDRAGDAQLDQFGGIADGEQAENDLVEQGEDGSVGADAEGEREDGGKSEAGMEA